MVLEKINRVNMLYDFYGSLLTEKQCKVIELYYKDDLSLGEIAEECNISRQAVFDLIRRGMDTLEKLESKLCLCSEFGARQNKLKKLLNMLEQELDSLKTEEAKKIILELMEFEFSE